MKHLFRKWCGPAAAFALAISTVATHAAQVQTLGGGPNQSGTARSGFKNGNTLLSAKFYNPVGVAVDDAGNLYVADKSNNKIRKITKPGDGDSLTSTFLSRLPSPVGVAIDGSSNVFVVTFGDGKLRKFNISGALLQTVGGLVKPTALALNNAGDAFVTELGGNVKQVAPDGTVSLITSGFNQPRGIAVLPGNLLAISESGGHAIYTVDANSGATTLIAGGNGAGFNNGPALAAQFNQPYGIAAAPNGALVIADRLNHRVRVLDRINNGTVSTLYGVDPHQWSSSFRGWADGTGGEDGTAHSREPVGLVVALNGNVYGTETYWDLIRQATGTGLGAGGTNVVLHGPTIICPPNLTANVTNSSSVTVNFASPQVLATNAASVVVSCVPPSGSIFQSGVTVVNCQASDASLITNRCSFNVQVLVTIAPNTISFGFETGEASSEFVGAAGQSFYAPVTLRVGSGQSLYTFQMSLSVTQEMGGPALPSSALTFKSMVDQRQDVITRNDFFIPPVFSTNTYYVPITNNVEFRNDAISMLGVGWITRFQQTNLYNTKEQDLITYSIAKDTLLGKSLGKVIFGAYGIQIPANAQPSDTFLIRISNPSGTIDGVTTPVELNIPTDGSLSNGAPNTIKRVVLSSRPYIVGDSTPFRWFNAGDFGDTNLANSDVMDVFQAAAYSLNTAITDSDLFNAMDSSAGNNVSGSYFELTGLIVPSPAYTVDMINSATNWDGNLYLDDVYVTFWRSLDPTLKWYARFWSNGVRQVVEVTNSLAGGAGSSKSVLAGGKAASAKSIARPSLAVAVDDVLAAPGSVLQLPIRVQVETYPLRTLLMNVSVEALDGSPAIAQNIQLQMAPTFGAPELSDSHAANNLAGAWLDNQITGITGNSVLAILTVRVPNSAGPHAAYRVHFDHFSGSPNGVALFQTRTSSGLILLSDRSASTWSDGISDAWRLRYFGSISAAESAVSADADGDGVVNADEYANGTDPTDPTSH